MRFIIISINDYPARPVPSSQNVILSVEGFSRALARSNERRSIRISRHFFYGLRDWKIFNL